jgi:hypothetical protein
MMGLVVFAKVFPGAVQTGLHRRNTGGKDFGNLGVAAAFLHQGEQRAILWTKLREGVTQSVEFLRVHCAGRFGNVLVLQAEGQKDPAQLLPAELINAGIARKPEEPRFKLGGSLEAIERTNHFYEHLLGKIFNIIRPAGHGIDKTSHAVLIADDELVLGGVIALLSPPDQISQRSR